MKYILPEVLYYLLRPIHWVMTVFTTRNGSFLYGKIEDYLIKHERLEKY